MANTSVRLICPNLKCRTILSVPMTARGKTVRCRKCSMRIQVPGGEAQAPDAAAASAEKR